MGTNKIQPMSYSKAKQVINEYALLQEIITRFTDKKYIVSFDSHGDYLQISVQPTATGMGSSVTIKKDANWFDALKAIELRLS